MDSWMIQAVEHGLREQGLPVRLACTGEFPADGYALWRLSKGEPGIMLTGSHLNTWADDSHFSVPLEDPRCFSKVAAHLRGTPPDAHATPEKATPDRQKGSGATSGRPATAYP